MSRIEQCDATCWVCGVTYQTHRILSESPVLRAPRPPRCPECGAYPRFGSGAVPESTQELLNSFLQGESAEAIGYEIETWVTDENQLEEWVESFAALRKIRLQQMREATGGELPRGLRPQTQALYDDNLFSTKLAQVRACALTRMQERKQKFLAQTN